MKSYKIIGLTGTTGAGKGVAHKAFEKNGFIVIEADRLAREIMKNPVVLENIRHHFGSDTVTDGVLNRKLLASRAFCDKAHTELLNSLTHPHITELLFIKLKEQVKAGKSKFVLDAPQLFESGLDIICDSIVSVLADRELRLQRITGRDGISAEEAEKRISAQLSDSFFRGNSDFVIENNGTADELIKNAESVINLL